MRGEKYQGKICEIHPDVAGLRFKSSYICVPCTTERSRAWRAANPRQNRNTMLLRKYGITYDQFTLLLEVQGGKCAICRGTEIGGSGDWHVDHNHMTGKVRGILCSPCNVGLGHFKDDPVLIETAAAYLRRHK